MIELLRCKMVNRIRLFIAKICGKEYGCCDKWFVNCSKCKYMQTDMYKRDDLIKKQDALMEARPEYLNPNLVDSSEYNMGWNNGIKAYWQNILELPPAESKGED